MTNLKVETNHINRVFLKGVILNKFQITNRLGEPIGVILSLDAGYKFFPQVVCFQDNADNVRCNYEIGDKIFLQGNVQSSKRDFGITTSIICNEILSSNLVADKKYNRFQVQGKVIKTFECQDNKLLILMKTFVDNRISTFFVKVNDADKYVHVFRKNQQLFVEGRVETNRKIDEEGQRQYFTNYVAEKIINL